VKALAFSFAVLMFISPIQSGAISKKDAADNLIGREFITAFTIVSSTQKIRFLPAVNVFGTRLRLNGQVEYSDGTYRTSRSRELVARLRPKSLGVHVIEAGTEARVLEILRNKKSIDITVASSEDTAVTMVNFGSKYDGYMVSSIGPLLGEEKTVHAQRVAVETAAKEAADALVREAELAAAKQAAETAAREKKYEEQQAMMQGKYVDGTYRRPVWMSNFKNQYRHPHAEGARITRSRARLIGIEFTLPFDIVTGHYSFSTEVTDSFLLNAYTGPTTRVNTVDELQGGPAGTELVVVPKGTRVRIIEASNAGGNGRSYLKLVTSDSDTVGVIVRKSSFPEQSADSKDKRHYRESGVCLASSM
jgi:hypothetical protein